jgi:hypothetical protein
MGYPHLEEELIGEVVDLDLLFEIPQTYARIIGGKGAEASSREAIMEVENMLKNTQEHTQTVGKEVPFIANQNRVIGGKSRAKTGQKSVSPGSAPDRPVHSPASTGPASESCSGRVSDAAPVRAPDRPVYSPAPLARNRPPGENLGAHRICTS